MWKLDGAELLSSSVDEDLVVLGVVDESVISLSCSGRVRISDPANRTPAAETPLKNCRRRPAVVKSVTLPKHRRVLLVSDDGLLYQVCWDWTHCHRAKQQGAPQDTDAFNFLSADFQDRETDGGRVPAASCPALSHR